MATKSVNIIDGDKLSSDLMEQLKYDLEHNPVRKLSDRERRIYMHVVSVALRNIPSFRDAIALIRPFMDASCETAYTDQYARVGFGYWFFYILNEDQQASVLLHECMHVLNNHFARRLDVNALEKNQKLFNIAGDLEINTVLNRVPFIDLKNACLPDHEPFFLPPMRTMEIYGELLLKQQKEKEENCPVHGKDAEEKRKNEQAQKDQQKQEKKDKQESGDEDGDDKGDDPQDQGDEAGDEAGDQDGGEQPGGETPGGESGEGQEEGDGSGSQPGAGDGHSHGDSGPKCNCGKDHDGDEDGDGEGQGQGSGSGQGQGQGQGNQQGDGKGWGCGDSDESTEKAADDAGIQRASDVETAIAKANTAARIVEEKNSKSRGLGHMDALFDSILQHLSPKKVDWRKVFRQVLTQSRAAIIRGRQDYTYRRTSRRLTSTEFVFPGMVNYLPKITLGIDTSGSMGNEDYQRALNEIDGIIREVAKGKDAIKMFSVDTQVGGIKPVSNVRKVNLTGGGGTQMAVAWQYIRDEIGKKDKPDIFVLSTDGYIDWADVEVEVRAAKFKSIILVTQFGGFQQAPESLKKLIPVICIDEETK